MVNATHIGRGRPPSRPGTKLGSYALEIMRSRGVNGGASGLADALNEEGVYSISQQMVSRYLTGQSDATLQFGRRFVRVFELSDKEIARLAQLLLMGQEALKG